MKAIVLSALAVISSAAFAYIPPYSMIMSRTAENHGRGTYVLDQDVTYKTENDSQTVHEVWTIVDENHMRLAFQGVGPLKDVVKGAILYENHTRIVNEGSGNKTQKLGEDWVEPLFFFRYSKNMRARLVQMKISPPESLREEAPLKADTDTPNYIPPSFVRLAKLNGMVTWEIQRNGSNADQPALWIEQDQFVVSKVRTPMKDTVEANDYVKYDNGFYAPKQRVYRWNDRSVSVQLKTVKSLGSASKGVMTTTGLTPFQFSGSDAIRDFYLRFR